jgi:signal transduction histidine kinase
MAEISDQSAIIHQLEEEVAAKNRALEVEAALERVRARTIVMQHSDELMEAANLLFQQVHLLGIPVWTCGFNIWAPEEKICTGWMSTNGAIQPSFRIPLTDSPGFLHMYESRKKGEDYFIEEISGEALSDHYRFMLSLPDFKAIASEQLKDGFSLPTLQVHHVFNFKHGNLIFIAATLLPENLEIFKRFAKVFEQTYTRFLDLQKAEGHAREAQIEAALEKVRSSSLAIHRSDELKKVVTVLFEKLKELDIPVTAAGINIFEAGSKDMNTYVCGQHDDGLVISNYLLPYFDHPICNDFHTVKEKHFDFFVGNYSREEKNNFYEHVIANTSLKDLPGDIMDMIFQSPGYTISMAPVHHSMIVINDFEGKALSPYETDIIKRFAKVFEQAYVRFLDLQKAEAHAREAQIEVALEKIRSRSLAMQHSEELEQLVTCLFDQLVALGLHFDGALIFLLDKEKRNIQLWVATVQLSAPVRIELPFDREIEKNTIIQDLWLTTAVGGSYLTKTYSGQTKDDYFRYVQKYNGEKIPDAVKQIQLECDAWTCSFATEKNSIIGFDSWSGHQSAVEDLNILLRFAKVFDQAYTRFLDLQKAEAQAREAQIETALEKIRSRSLGMHSSVEIKFVVAILFEKLKELNLEFDGGAAIHLFAEGTRDAVIWVAAPDLSEPTCVDLPYDENAFINNPIITDIWRAKETGKHIYNKSYSFDEKNTYFNYVFRHNDLKTIPESSRVFISQADSYTASFIAEKNSLMGANSWSRQQFSGDDFEVLKRIARVFEQAYVRFLDLQKAEMQAREAEIQLALERVRARTMAMHRSEELSEVVTTIYEQLRFLDFKYGGFNILIIDKESGDSLYWVAGFTEKIHPVSYLIKYFNHPYYEAQIAPWRNGEKYAVLELTGELKKSYDEIFFTQTEFRDFSEESKRIITQSETAVLSTAYIRYGALQWGPSPLSEDHSFILKRIAKVFEQTYTRFLDLQKAEAQAREAQIELALERVRARTMAMQKSEDLREVVMVLYSQLANLGFQWGAASITIMDSVTGDMNWWLEGFGDGYDFPESYHVPFFNHIGHNQQLENWKNGITYSVVEISGVDKKSYDDYYFNHTDFVRVPENTKQLMKQQEVVLFSMAYMKYGALSWSPTLLSEAQSKILQRFAKVFEQTYTRFLDLQKAEAQAREAQIELGLERVRARAMAMQQSDELAELVHTVFKELTRLHFFLDRCIIMIYDPETNGSTWWMSNSEEAALPIGSFVKYHEHIPYLEYLKAWENRYLKWVYLLEGTNKKEWDEFLFAETELASLPEFVKAGMRSIEGVFLNVSFNNFGSLTLASLEPLPESHFDILLRFAKVFDLTYTRFNDLKKAEAQAREAQIEVAVERVRAKALAMHHSDEIADVARIMRNELGRLKIEGLFAATIYLEQDDGTVRLWDITIADNIMENGPKSNWDRKVHLEDLHPRLFIKRIWGSAEKYFVIKQNEQDFPVLIEWVYQFNRQGAEEIERTIKENNIKHTWFAGVQLEHGRMSIELRVLPPNEAESILSKIGAAFDLAYKRFLDLQKAEAQAREAKIEAALERVRAKTMAMQKSEELREVVAIIFQQLQHLEFTDGACSIVIMDELSGDMIWWISGISKPYPESYHIPFFNHPFYKAQLSNWKEGRKYAVMEVSGKEKKLYDEFIFSKTEFVRIPEEIRKGMMAFEKINFSNAYMKHGALSWGVEPLTDEHAKILQRFAVVFEQTYTRFLDLQKAETQALEAIKRASVDRVRAEIASMRSTNDLQRITPLIWNELTILGIPFIRCGVFIMDEERQEVQTMLSTPEGNAIATLHVPYSFDLSITTNGVQYWRKKEIYKEHWDSTTFRQTWGKLSLLRDSSADAPQMDHPPENLNLHLLPFLQGMLYVGSAAPLNDDELQLGQNLADAFSTAYARYEDFNKLELAKKQVDSTLKELQATQAQLIQSEKMASLGELTAGIAHEIQNPLNFVNNFSEVNRELLEELNEEIEKGNYEEVKMIAADISGNEEKINLHGKRADAIVKGMLQHSRTSSSAKEPTDINALTDEFLRLAYHGLRAKDKSFNAGLQTIFDPVIGKVNIIPQDIGRVILNVVTNAFYAVNEKKKLLVENYEPTVSLTTKKLADTIEIIIADNGNGIPQKVVDKIFQPFFTTKPTGSGIGLGLSIAYDIIKSHGGEIKMETKVGEGTQFLIKLPYA